MKKIVIFGMVLAAALSAGAQGMMAMLVSQSMGTSVTGQTIVVCLYSYGNTRFERYYPLGNMCPLSIQVQ